MSQEAESEGVESRTRYFGNKRTHAAAQGESSGASTPRKRSRRSRLGHQHVRDFVPMGGNSSSSHQVMKTVESDPESSSDSSIVSAANPQSYRTGAVAMNDNAKDAEAANSAAPALGQNRLASGFSNPFTSLTSDTIAGGEVQQSSRGHSTSHNSIGESADDAIEISDDTDMEDQSDTGGVMINLEDEDAVVEASNDHRSNSSSANDSDGAGSSHIIASSRPSDICHFRVTGWAESSAINHKDGGFLALYHKLQFEAARGKGSRKKRLKKAMSYRRIGDTMLISVPHDAAKGIREYDGQKFYRAVIRVEEITGDTASHVDRQMPDSTSIQEGTGVSEDGEVEEDEEVAPGPSASKDLAETKCVHCSKTNHKSKRCRQKLEGSTVSLASDQSAKDDAHTQLQGDLERSLAATPTSMPISTTAQPLLRLGDLSSEEFEKQVRYTLFQLNRDQIDYNRPVVCITCLREGHLETACPDSNCIYCGARNEHSSRTCPSHRRCLKCRQRGHDVDTCISKLKDTSVPCEYCSSGKHLENACPMRFFPARNANDRDEIKLWISCCICASKTHLVGDCPQQRPSDEASAWSLRSLDSNQVTNLSLEAGTRKLEKDAENRGMRPEGLKIKGRADAYVQQQPVGDDVDEPFLRPPVGKQDNFPRRGGPIRIENRGFDRDRRQDDRRQDEQDNYYRPSDRNYRPQEARYDRYEASYTDYRDQPQGRRDKFYATDSFGQRRRSRSPDYGQDRGGRSSFQPPLPREPLPTRPLPLHQQLPDNLPVRPAQSTRNYGGAPGTDSYRPMPSAAKQAWNKGRL